MAGHAAVPITSTCLSAEDKNCCAELPGWVVCRGLRLAGGNELANLFTQHARHAYDNINPPVGEVVMSMGSVLNRGVFWLAAKAMLMMLTGFAPPVQAFIDPPYLTPEHPGAGETVSVNIRFGICDAIGELPSAGYPRITRNGDELRIVFWSTTNLDPILCNVPVLTETYALGAFPAGTYTVQVDRDYFGDLGGILTETLGVIPFTVVAPSPPVSVPTLGRFGLALLLIALAGLVAWRKREAGRFTRRGSARLA